MEMATQMTNRLRGYIEQVNKQTTVNREPIVQRKRVLVTQHRKARATLSARQATRWQEETRTRSQKLPRGLKGIWFRLREKYQRIKAKNEQETKSCHLRDRDEKQTLITRQLSERQKLQQDFNTLKQEHLDQLLTLKQDIARYKDMGTESQEKIKDLITVSKNRIDPDYEPEM